MTLWADADSLPKEVRELVARRASLPASGIRAVFVANRKLPLPPGANLTAVIVGRAGSTAKKTAEPETAPNKAAAEDADSYILARASAGDIIVTRDIPLASRAIAQGLIALNDRGELWTADTVRERLSLRDHAEALRKAGLVPELNRNRLFGPKERGAFANALDKALLQARRGLEEAPAEQALP
ncbi:MAG TPA: hypothetical protein DCG47_13735 [Spirochaetaceae bacterium]|nr:hypothetical protein [Spirochaetaceae bacterium]